jgi:phospholipid/cholesterol/gamma-HCH transport system ATP-binding protein
MVMGFIDIKRVSKSFNGNIVLDDVSLTMDEGENLVIFGRSGTGKSVLLKCILKLLEPDEGEIYVDGKNILIASEAELNDVRKFSGYLFQGSALYDSMTVKENLEFPLIRNFDFTQKEIDEKINKALKKVSLEDTLNKMPSELSGGMKKRIALARTIITEPRLILYDEPTTGLDPITSKEISQLIVELQSDLNVTSVVVTHDLYCAHIVADHAVVLHDGKIRYRGTINELTSSEDKFLKDFFSGELINNNGDK